MIKIDGKEGGGQILRTALSLSMITGKGFHMQNIRGKRSKDGLMRQHLTCVKAATTICDAAVDGDVIRSTELLFSPDQVKAGSYTFRIGSAGSTTLLFQTLLPALIHAEGRSSLRLHGGTHNPMAPSADFISRSFLPQLCKMGASIKFNCERLGFAPAGGGVISAMIDQTKKLAPLSLTDRGKELSRKVEIVAANLRSSVVKEEQKSLSEMIDWPASCYTVREENAVDGSGNVLVLEVEYENHVLHVTSHGAFQKTSNRVAKDAVKAMLTYQRSAASIGPRLADQLLLPMALAGSGEISTVGLTNHMKTNIETIEAFLDVKFLVKECVKGEYIISLS